VLLVGGLIIMPFVLFCAERLRLIIVIKESRINFMIVILMIINYELGVIFLKVMGIMGAVIWASRSERDRSETSETASEAKP
jgi:hypothetical protein